MGLYGDPQMKQVAREIPSGTHVLFGAAVVRKLGMPPLVRRAQTLAALSDARQIMRLYEIVEPHRISLKSGKGLPPSALRATMVVLLGSERDRGLEDLLNCPVTVASLGSLHQAVQRGVLGWLEALQDGGNVPLQWATLPKSLRAMGAVLPEALPARRDIINLRTIMRAASTSGIVNVVVGDSPDLTIGKTIRRRPRGSRFDD